MRAGRQGVLSKTLLVLGMVVGVLLTAFGIFVSIPGVGLVAFIWTFLAGGVTIYYGASVFARPGIRYEAARFKKLSIFVALLTALLAAAASMDGYVLVEYNFNRVIRGRQPILTRRVSRGGRDHHGGRDSVSYYGITYGIMTTYSEVKLHSRMPLVQDRTHKKQLLPGPMSHPVDSAGAEGGKESRPGTSAALAPSSRSPRPRVSRL